MHESRTRRRRVILLGAICGLLLGAVFATGYLLGAGESAPSGIQASFAIVWKVQRLLERTFIGDAPPLSKQVYGAAHGLAASYDDPYTVFVEPASREVERDDLRGHFGGIGVYMSRNELNELVLTVMPGRSAARAGLQNDDVLLAVDGHPVAADDAINELIASVRGEVGTTVILTIRRAGVAEPFDAPVLREQIDTPSVEWRILDRNARIGYMSVRVFGERTSDEIREGLAEMAVDDVQRLVLDLRGNGGGLLDAAVATASQFLREGAVLTEIRRGGQERFYPVKRVRSPAQAWQLVVLVDHATASAAEIVAGALRDHERALLVGERTFGKGSVQEVHEFADGSSLHVTVSTWLTPDRAPIEEAGLEPDIAVEMTDEDRQAGKDPQLARAQMILAGSQ